MYNVYIMLYTSIQAAQFLGISKHAVRKLVVEGKLKDVATTKPGTSRHAMRLQLSELKEYKKTNNLKSSFSGKPGVRKSRTSILNFPGAGILSRLDRIEQKVDIVEAGIAALLKLWS